MSFLNKVVVITGSSSGIGAATAKLFAKEGADVVIVDRKVNKLANVAAEIKTIGKQPLVLTADVSNDNDAKTIIEKTLEKFKKIDVLVNNAGFGKFGSIMGNDIVAAYDAVMATNLRAVVYLTTLAAPHLVKTKGNIINISSVASQSTIGVGLCTYEISKAGLSRFTKGAAFELSAYGVRVNAISPGPVRTDIIENSELDRDLEKIGLSSPLKRCSEPEEIGDLILFLASDKAKGITGSDFVSDNGVLIKGEECCRVFFILR